MFKNYYLLLIFCLLCSPFGIFAQLNNDVLKQSFQLSASDTNRIKFSFESFSFLKNNEYFNNTVDGYTLFGEQINPKISYQPSKNLLVQGGLFAMREFGREKLTQVTPTFTVKYLNQDWQLLFGNLEGTVSHRLVEPLMNTERRITRPQELGWQIKKETKHRFLDIWLDWLTAQKAGEMTQEEVLGGISWQLPVISNQLSVNSNNLQLVAKSQNRHQGIEATPDVMLSLSKHESQEPRAKSQEGFDFAQPDNLKPHISHPTSHLSLIAQITIYHRGGQIDINPTPLTTQLNPALGFRWRKAYDNKIFHSLTAENYWLGFSEISALHQSGFSKGHGLYLNLSTQTKFGELMGSYWAGTNYVSPIGGDLFQGVSRRWDSLNQFAEPKRKILILRHSNNLQLTRNAHLISRLEPYYDFGGGFWNWSSTLFLVVNINPKN